MANEEAGLVEEPAAEDGGKEDEGGARAAGPHKPGFVSRLVERCHGAVERITLPAPDWRTFAWGLLILIALAFVIRNWAPVRINLFGWYCDAPRAVVFGIIFLLGMATAWLLEVRNRRSLPPVTGETPAATDEERAPAEAAIADEFDDIEDELAGDPWDVEPADEDDLDVEDDEVPI